MTLLVQGLLKSKNFLLTAFFISMFHINAYSGSCVSKVVSTEFSARNTDWISPNSGYLAPLYSLLGNEQLFNYVITFEATCIPKIEPNFNSLPSGVHIQVGADFRYLVGGNYVDSSFVSASPVEIRAFAFYFVTVDSILPEGAVNGNLLTLLDGTTNLSTSIALKIDKTAPTAIQDSEFALQCLYTDLSNNEFILVQPKWQAEPANQSPLSYIVGYLSSTLETNYDAVIKELYSRTALTLFATDGGYYSDVQIGPNLYIKSKDYGQPIQFVRFDIAHNRSAFSKKYTFSKSTINAKYNKRTGRCVAR